MKNMFSYLFDKFKNTTVGMFVCQHPYWVLFFVVLIHTFFFNQYTLYDMIKAKMSISKLNAEYDYYQNKIQEDSIKLHNLKTDNQNLIKFAREVYGMKKDKEEVYIIRYK